MTRYSGIAMKMTRRGVSGTDGPAEVTSVNSDTVFDDGNVKLTKTLGDPVISVAFSKDGNRIAAGSINKVA